MKWADDATSWTWTSSNAGVSFAPNNTDQNPLVSNIADGDEITVEVSNGTCTNTSSATISINLLPDDSFSVTGESIESGESATISQSGSEADVEYQLRYHSDSTNVPGISPKTQTGGSELISS
jgi:PKD repeat protein